MSFEFGIKISIITITFNSEITVRDTFESVLSQNYNYIEYIVIDGGSEDSTLDIIKEYDFRFCGHMLWVSEPDNGIYDAMNKGISLATGDIIGILNSDDFYMHNDVISQIIEGFIKTNVDAIYTNLYVVDPIDTNKIIRNAKWKAYKKRAFFKGWHPPHPSLFVKKKVYDNYGTFDLSYKIAADYDFMLRVFEVYHISSFFLNSYTIKMRNGGASTSGIGSFKIRHQESIKSFKKYGLKLNRFLYYLGRFSWKITQYSFQSFYSDVIKHYLFKIK